MLLTVADFKIGHKVTVIEDLLGYTNIDILEGDIGRVTEIEMPGHGENRIWIYWYKVEEDISLENKPYGLYQYDPDFQKLRVIQKQKLLDDDLFDI